MVRRIFMAVALLNRSNKSHSHQAETEKKNLVYKLDFTDLLTLSRKIIKTCEGVHKAAKLKSLKICSAKWSKMFTTIEDE